jgi:hypothetical protein
MGSHRKTWNIGWWILKLEHGPLDAGVDGERNNDSESNEYDDVTACCECLENVGRVCRTADRILTPLNGPRAERNCVPLMHHVDCWPVTSQSVRLSADSVHDTVTHVAHFICLELCPNDKDYTQWGYSNWHNICETVLSCRPIRMSMYLSATIVIYLQAACP